MIFRRMNTFFAINILGLLMSFEFVASWQQTWECRNGKCVKNTFSSANFVNKLDITQEICQLTCGKYGSMWPKPTGLSILGSDVVELNPINISFNFSETKDIGTINEYLRKISKIFQSKLVEDCGSNCSFASNANVTIQFFVMSPDLKLYWDTDESYTLDVTSTDSNVFVKIRSKTVYGSRHALETLGQLMVTYTPSSSLKTTTKSLVMVSFAKISDAPAFAHRGLLLDTARNFMPVSTIYRTLDAMAMVKMNIFHWHVSDSQSFPLETPRAPLLTRYGAYSSEQVYTVNDTKTILEYARLRGIRVILEVDAPAHAGNGWQWGESYDLGKLAVCVNKQPWRKYCIQPPCGQLNPVNPNVYKILKDIYADIISMSPPGEAFHMGGDEVYFPCWNSTPEIIAWMESVNISRNEKGFLDLWANFQKSALGVFDEINPVCNSSVILWSSHLTDPSIVENYLDKNRYIIETWLEASNPIPNELLSKGYRLIMATKDKWYLDHGFWGNTKYHNWKSAYNNKLPEHKNVLGGEATMWSELVDSYSLDFKLWPRTAAVGERLWSNPRTFYEETEARIQNLRHRMLRRGIYADAISPYYCYQNEGDCL